LVGERDRLVEARTGTKMVTKFVVGRAEPGGSVEEAEPPHGVVALLDPSMVLLDPVVESTIKSGAPCEALETLPW